MNAVEVIEEQVGEDIIWLLNLPSYKKNQKRMLVVVKPSPAELMFGEVVGRDEHLIISEEGEEISYKVIGLNEFMKELLLGKDLDVFLGILDRKNINIDSSDGIFVSLFNLLNDHYRELSETINSCNYAHALVEEAKQIGVSGDALYLSKHGLDKGTNVEKDIIRYNEMIFKTQLMKFQLGLANVPEYCPKGFDEVDEEVLSKETEDYKRVLHDFRGKYEQYMQPLWKNDISEWVNSVLCLSLKLLAK